ncbi:MAG: hypothetical protein FIA82_09290 [Melioribacter sp.]|nr:hypothetical protein [Melioribacter sp.]
MKSQSKVLLVLSALVLCFLFLLIHILNIKPIITYSIIYISSSIIFIFISYLILKNEIPFRYVVGFVAVGILLRLSFISVNPIGSDDYYRYMWDGKVQSAGINPYLYLPHDPVLLNLHSEIIPKLINNPELKTIYFPLSQWLFYAGYSLSGESVWGYKLLLLVSELMTLFALFLLIKKKKLPEKYILLYALCPLPIIQFSLDAHLDGFGLPLLIFALFFYVDNKKILSLIFLGLSFSIKPVGFLFLPILFFYEKKLTDRIKIVFIPAIAFSIQFLPYIFSSNPFEAFFIYAKHWTFNGIVFNIINSSIQNNQTARIICGILLVICFLPFIFNKMDLLHKYYYSVLLLMIFSPVVHPWYLAWLAVLLPIFPRWSGIFFVGFSSSTVFTVLNYQLNGLWKEYPIVLLLEYLPVISIFIYELRKETKLLFPNAN